MLGVTGTGTERYPFVCIFIPSYMVGRKDLPLIGISGLNKTKEGRKALEIIEHSTAESF